MENEAMEIMENVTEAIVENDTITPMPCEAPEARLGTAIIRGVIFGGVILGTLLLVKKDELKERRTERRIKKLEKAGYTVIRTESIIDETQEVCVEEVAD